MAACDPFRGNTGRKKVTPSVLFLIADGNLFYWGRKEGLPIPGRKNRCVTPRGGQRSAVLILKPTFLLAFASKKKTSDYLGCRSF